MGQVTQGLVPEIDACDANGEVLLDVREADEFSWGRAPKSVHIPLYELPARLDEVPPNRPVYVICKVGARSAQAVMWLQRQGIDAVNVRGGLVTWVHEGLPLESDGPRPWLV
ncbi:MAG: Rhodanese-related sulfurtransferase-like protein [Frankiales bacterium]|nr:Rhodanese-related sulfurtransferase-like protein [Frankiales bacterium]